MMILIHDFSSLYNVAAAESGCAKPIEDSVCIMESKCVQRTLMHAILNARVTIDVESQRMVIQY